MAQNIDQAAKAILDEIKRLNQESMRLTKIFAQLTGAELPGTTAGDSQTPPKGKRGRGRPRKAAEPTKAYGDGLKAALEIIRSEEGGVKAIRLARLLSDAGHAKPSKAELMESGKIKASGKGGGMTYSYAG